MKYLKSKAAVLVYAALIFCFVSFDFLNGELILFSQKAGLVILTDSVLLYTFAAVGFLFLAAWFVRRVCGHRGVFFYLMAGIISLVYSGVSFMGKFYSSHPGAGLAEILKKEHACLKAGICLLGGWILFFSVLLGLDLLREYTGLGEGESPRPGEKVWNFLFGRYCFAKQCLVIGLCWLPHILLRYPGAIPQDGRVALMQYYGVRAYTTQHPIIYTLLVGKLADLGARLGSPNYGLFALVWLQSVLMTLAFSYMIWTMRKLRVPDWCCAFALFMCAVTPNAVAFATAIQIDALYLAAFTVLMTELVWYLFEPEQYKSSWKHLLLTGVAVLGTFFRYNGIYIVAAVLALSFCREVYLLLKKQQKLKYSLILCLVYLIPILAGRVGVHGLNDRYSSIAISGRAIFALPIQQASRYMVYHSEDLTKEELEKFQKVMTLPVEEYKTRYNPLNFDGVKQSFNTKATSGEIRDFLEIWLKMLSRHPLTCIQATLEQNYLLFSPLLTSGRFHENERKLSEQGTLGKGNLLKKNQGDKTWMRLRENLNQYYDDFLQSPFGGVLMNIGWHTLLLLGFCLYALCGKNWKFLFLAVPLLLTIAIIFVGPAIYAHQRYMLPVFYTMPLLLGLFADGRKWKTEIDNKES